VLLASTNRRRRCLFFTPSSPRQALTIFIFLARNFCLEFRENKISKQKLMDTTTYASAATLSMSVSQDQKNSFAPEVDFTPLNLSYIHRST
jgi:hypothetical protein